MVDLAVTWWGGWHRSLRTWLLPRPGKSRGVNGRRESDEAMTAIGSAFVAAMACCQVALWGLRNGVLISMALSTLIAGATGLAVWCYRYGQGDATRTPRVLLVEDDPDTWAAMAREFACLGYAVMGANTVDDALAKLVTNAPDWVVVDYRLWGGTTAMPILRAVANMKSSPRTAIVTAYATLTLVRECMDLGVECVIEKPDYGRLVAMLARDCRDGPAMPCATPGYATSR